MLNQLKQRVARMPGIRGIYNRWRFGGPREFSLDGVSVVLSDLSSSPIFPVLLPEVKSEYALETLDIRPGDVVVDIGAHVGTVSVYLGKRHPYATVYSYEPVPSNYRSLVHNIRKNGLTNVRAFNVAVTSDGRDVYIDPVMHENSGGGAFARGSRRGFAARSTTFDRIIEDNGIDRCRLLKIDCEGAEHEILRATRHLDRVENLRGEFHEDEYLRAQGHTVAGLEEYCARFIDPARMHVVRYVG